MQPLITAEPELPAETPPAETEQSPSRWMFWRSPVDQPRWARPALLAIAAVAAIADGWGIASRPMAGFYSAAVRSMSMSWKAFFFGAVDPAGSITIDKIPGAFWPQALSARIFGFNDFAVMLPQVIEAVITVLILYRVVRRWSGPTAGLIAAAVMAATPIAAALAKTEIADTALTLCLVLAADAWQRSIGTGRLRSLLLAGVWVGLGVHVKMLQAWAVLPAFAIAYLVVAPITLRRRISHVVLAGIVTAAASSLWMVLVLLTPAADRPFVDATTDNNPVGMVVGYNGLSRFGATRDASSEVGSVSSGRGGGNRTPANSGNSVNSAEQEIAQMMGGRNTTGVTAMLSNRMAPQIGWLFPLVLLSLIFGIAWRGRASRTDAIRAGFLMWGIWFVVHAIVFSVGQVNHSFYVVVMAPAIAALSGAGIVTFWRAYRAGGWRSWLLSISIAATVVWAITLSERFSDFLPWLAPVAGVLGIGAVGTLILAKRLSTRGARLAVFGLVAGIAGMLISPGAWAASVLNPAYAGGSSSPAAGPAGEEFGGGPRETPPGRGGSAAENAMRAFGGETGLTARDRKLLEYLDSQAGGAKYLVAVQSSMSAARYITGAGVSILPMGGFTGQTPFPTADQFQTLIRGGELRFVLGGGGMGGMFGGGSTGTSLAAANVAWAEQHCSVVDPQEYGGSATDSTDQGARQGGPGRAPQKLYDCQGAVK